MDEEEEIARMQEIADTLSGADRANLLAHMQRLGMHSYVTMNSPPFTQEGVGKLLSSPAFADSIQSVREALPVTFGVEPRSNPVIIKNYVNPTSQMGYVDTREPDVVNMNMFDVFKNQMAANHLFTDYELTELAEERYRNTLLHELYHSAMGNSMLAHDEDRANYFAAGFTGLSSATPEDTREDIINRALEDYLRRDDIYKANTAPVGRNERSMVTVIEKPETRQALEDMISRIAQAEVFADNPWNYSHNYSQNLRPHVPIQDAESGLLSRLKDRLRRGIRGLINR